MRRRSGGITILTRNSVKHLPMEDVLEMQIISERLGIARKDVFERCGDYACVFSENH